jgi:preprotein translocase subunit SecE
MARTTDAKPARFLQRPARPLAPRQSPALVQRIVRYLREVRTELGRVDWPSRKELVGSTLVVVVVLVALSLYLGAWDYLFTFTIRRWLIGPTP